ncbi:MAG: hypothetical protein RLZZ350_1150 [Verrucomicrobiota bacterium]
MQISKNTKILLALALIAASLTHAIAQDAEEVAARDKAREELNKKMAELEAQLQEAEQPKPAVGEPAGVVPAASNADAEAAAQKKADADSEKAAVDLQAKVDAEKAAKAEADAKADSAKADAAKAQAAAETKAKAEMEATFQAEQKSKAEALAAKVEADAAKAAAELQAKVDAEKTARAQAEAAVAQKKTDEARAAAERQAQAAKAEAQAKTETARIKAQQAEQQARAEAAAKAAEVKPVVVAPKTVVTQVAPTTAPNYGTASRADSDRIAQAREELRRALAEKNQPQSAPVRAVAQPNTAPAVRKVEATPVARPVAVAQPALKVVTQPVAVPAPAPVSTGVGELVPVSQLGSMPASHAPATVTQTISYGGNPQPVTTVNQPVAKPVAKPTPVKMTEVKAATKPAAKLVATAKPQPVKAKPTARADAEAQALKAAKTAAPLKLSAADLTDAPPAAVSAAKQSKLNDLLARYKSDKISANEYHTERAKILAE